MESPNHKIARLLSIKEEQLSTLSEREQKVYRVIHRQESDPYIEKALSIYNNISYKMFLESLLFSDLSIDEVSSLLSIDKPIVEVYSEVCYDVSVFKNKMDKIEYFNNLKNRIKNSIDKMKDVEVKEEDLSNVEFAISALKIMLIYLRLGKKYIEYFLGGKDISREDMANLILSLTKDVFITATFNKMLSKNDEAREWFRIGSNLISSLKILEGNKKGEEVDKSVLEHIKMKLMSKDDPIFDINIGDIVG